MLFSRSIVKNMIFTFLVLLITWNPAPPFGFNFLTHATPPQTLSTLTLTPLPKIRDAEGSGFEHCYSTPDILSAARGLTSVPSGKFLYSDS